MDTNKPVDVGFYEGTDTNTVIPYDRRDVCKVWLVMGRSAVHYADKSIAIDRPALILSNPLTPYAYEVFGEYYSGYYCLFTEAFVTSSRRQEDWPQSPLFRTGSHPVYFPDEGQLSELMQLFKKLKECADSGHNIDLMPNYLHQILQEASKMERAPAQEVTPGSKPRTVGLFKALLERQFPITCTQEQLRLRRAGDYARCLSINVNHLNFAVRELTGRSTSAHIKARLIDEARRLLRTTDWRIIDIAWCLGFEYPNHFNTFFRKHTGITPLSARKGLQNTLID